MQWKDVFRRKTRYISNNRTETYVLAGKDGYRLHGTGWNASDSGRDGEGDRVEGGGSYRMKATLDQREYELFLKNGWKQDRDGYIWYYEPASRKKYGTVDCPFTPTLLKNAQGKIVDCYLTIPAKLPTGSYESDRTDCTGRLCTERS